MWGIITYKKYTKIWKHVRNVNYVNRNKKGKYNVRIKYVEKFKEMQTKKKEHKKGTRKYR